MSISFDEPESVANRVFPRPPLAAEGRDQRRGVMTGALRLQMAERLPIAAVQTLSTVDFPQHLAAVIRCGRRSSADASHAHSYSWDAFEYFLHRWQNRLNGVVFTGEEPTEQDALVDAIARCRELGFAAALHTRGGQPERLLSLAPSLEWISLEIPAPEQRPQGREDEAIAWRSLAYLLAAGASFECRTRLQRGLIEPAMLLRLAERLAALGVRDYTLELCNGPLPPLQEPRLLEPAEEAALWARCSGLFRTFRFREIEAHRA